MIINIKTKIINKYMGIIKILCSIKHIYQICRFMNMTRLESLRRSLNISIINLTNDLAMTKTRNYLECKEINRLSTAREKQLATSVSKEM